MERSLISVGSTAKRFKVSLALLAALPALLLVDTALALGGGWTSGRLGAVVASLALTLAGTLLIAALPAGRFFLDRHGSALVYVVYSAAAAWLAAEAVVGAFLWYGYGHPAAQPFHLRPPQAHWVFRPDPSAIPGIKGVSNYTTNSLGIRGPEFPPRDSAYRILAIGGSTTECTFLDDSEAWWHLVMERLNQEEGREKVWIGSAGASGYLTVHHLRFIQESPLMDEVDALVFLIGANDHTSFIRGRLREGEFLSEPRPIWRRSPILNFARSLWHRRMSDKLAEDWAGQHHSDRRLERQQGTIRKELPDMRRALQQYEARIEAIIQLARGYGVRPIFITQPTLWDENLTEHGRSLLWLGDINRADGEYLSVEAGRAGIDKHNDVLKKVCKRLSVECISTDSMHGQERFYYDDFHFTEAGARELARLVAEHFLAHSNGNG